MAFNDLEYQAVKKEVHQFIESIRPPEHIRNELDIVYSINDQTIDIGEQRPVWQGNQVKQTSCHQQESSTYVLWIDGKSIGCGRI